MKTSFHFVGLLWLIAGSVAPAIFLIPVAMVFHGPLRVRLLGGSKPVLSSAILNLVEPR